MNLIDLPSIFKQAHISKYTSNNTYNIDNPHSIFDLDFNCDKIRKLNENVQRVIFTDKLLIINFISYDYIIDDNNYEIITDEDIKNVFKNDKTIIFKNADRQGNIIEQYEFIDCKFESITDDLYDYNLNITGNKIKCLILTFKNKNKITNDK